MPQVKKEEILVHWIDNFYESQVFEMYLGASAVVQLAYYAVD